MNRGRRDFEVALEVRLCRRPTIHFRVRIDEGEILALQARELGHPFMMSRRQQILGISGGVSHPLDARVGCLHSLIN